MISNLSPFPVCTTRVGHRAELALLDVMQRDADVIAQRRASEQLEADNAAREIMRERALVREARRRAQGLGRRGRAR